MARKKKAAIHAMTNLELLRETFQIIEVNAYAFLSKSGLTKGKAKQEEALKAECLRRFVSKEAAHG